MRAGDFPALIRRLASGGVEPPEKAVDRLTTDGEQTLDDGALHLGS